MQNGKYELTRGEGRLKVNLLAHYMGNDLVLLIYNDNPHIGAVAIGDYSLDKNRASTSVITKLGHKDDIIAQQAAYLVSKATRKPVCVIAGVHLDNISREEINELVRNANIITEEFIKSSLGMAINHDLTNNG